MTLNKGVIHRKVQGEVQVQVQVRVTGISAIVIFHNVSESSVEQILQQNGMRA